MSVILVDEEYVKLLLSELKWAYDNMSYVRPEPDEWHEYDFCVLCNRPEWQHAKNCEGIKHEDIVKELVKKS